MACGVEPRRSWRRSRGTERDGADVDDRVHDCGSPWVGKTGEAMIDAGRGIGGSAIEIWSRSLYRVTYASQAADLASHDVLPRLH
jgi:hypothetical protein